MAKLTSAKRRNLPASDFAGPARSYPVNDANHARNALARASQAANEGRISKSEEARIDAKAHAKLGEYRGNGKVGHTGKARTGAVRTWQGK